LEREKGSRNSRDGRVGAQGILYGTCDLAGNVRCEAIYEPPQEGDADAYKLLEDGAPRAAPPY
jgi:hypothetical protein